MIDRIQGLVIATSGWTRNRRDVLVTEALRMRNDGLASEVRVSYGP